MEEVIEMVRVPREYINLLKEVNATQEKLIDNQSEKIRLLEAIISAMEDDQK